MKTIEERAEEMFPVSYEEGYGDLNESRRKYYIKIATEQKAIDFAMFQSFLSERGLLFGKYTKATGDTGYKTLDDLWAYFNNKE